MLLTVGGQLYMKPVQPLPKRVEVPCAWPNGHIADVQRDEGSPLISLKNSGIRKFLAFALSVSSSVAIISLRSESATDFLRFKIERRS